MKHKIVSTGLISGLVLSVTFCLIILDQPRIKGTVPTRHDPKFEEWKNYSVFVPTGWEIRKGGELSMTCPSSPWVSLVFRKCPYGIAWDQDLPEAKHFAAKHLELAEKSLSIQFTASDLLQINRKEMLVRHGVWASACHGYLFATHETIEFRWFLPRRSRLDSKVYDQAQSVINWFGYVSAAARKTS